MARVTISRVFEVSKLLTTKAGSELKDGLTYLADFADVTLRNLRNGLTFFDNFQCELKSVSLKNDVETIVTPATTNRINQIMVKKSGSNTYYCWDSFGWKYNANGEIVVKIKYTDFNPADSSIAYPVEILLLY